MFWTRSPVHADSASFGFPLILGSRKTVGPANTVGPTNPREETVTDLFIHKHCKAVIQNHNNINGQKLCILLYAERKTYKLC